MYIHALHSGWLENPFWRKSFLLIKQEDRDEIRTSIPHVTIDLTKGRGLTLHPAGANVAPQAPLIGTAPPIARIRPRRRRPPTALELASVTAERATEAVITLFSQARLGRVIRTADLSPIVEEIAQTTAPGAAAMIAVTRLKDKDRYTYIHSVAVGTLMIALGRHLGLSEEDVRVAGMAGLLHDIGKMQVDPQIVDKPGRLNPDELAEMRLHPSLGHSLLVDTEDLDPRILDVCRHHHEKMDGTGYPDGLKGDELSVFARISAVCDVYDAVTSIRSYKRAWSAHEALAQMLAWDGHLDPDILRAFIIGLGIQPLGALVRLHSNRLGIVSGEGDSPTSPIVRIFFDVHDQRMIPIHDVDTSLDPVLRSERGDYWFGDRWLAIQAEIMARSETPEPPLRRAAGL